MTFCLGVANNQPSQEAGDGGEEGSSACRGDRMVAEIAAAMGRRMDGRVGWRVIDIYNFLLKNFINIYRFLLIYF